MGWAKNDQWYAFIAISALKAFHMSLVGMISMITTRPIVVG